MTPTGGSGFAFGTGGRVAYATGGKVYVDEVGGGSPIEVGAGVSHRRARRVAVPVRDLRGTIKEMSFFDFLPGGIGNL